MAEGLTELRKKRAARKAAAEERRESKAGKISMTVSRNYFDEVYPQAEKIHKHMKRMGFYMGKKVKVAGITVAVPREYPNKVLAAIEQMAMTDLNDTMKVELIGELMLRLNGVDPDGVYLIPSDVNTLMGVKKRDLGKRKKAKPA